MTGAIYQSHLSYCTARGCGKIDWHPLTQKNGRQEPSWGVSIYIYWNALNVAKLLLKLKCKSEWGKWCKFRINPMKITLNWKVFVCIPACIKAYTWSSFCMMLWWSWSLVKRRSFDFLLLVLRRPIILWKDWFSFPPHLILFEVFLALCTFFQAYPRLPSFPCSQLFYLALLFSPFPYFFLLFNCPYVSPRPCLFLLQSRWQSFL